MLSFLDAISQLRIYGTSAATSIADVERAIEMFGIEVGIGPHIPHIEEALECLRCIDSITDPNHPIIGASLEALERLRNLRNLTRRLEDATKGLTAQDRAKRNTCWLALPDRLYFFMNALNDFGINETPATHKHNWVPVTEFNVWFGKSSRNGARTFATKAKNGVPAKKNSAGNWMVCASEMESKLLERGYPTPSGWTSFLTTS